MSWLVWVLVALPLATGTCLGVAGRRANRLAPGAGVAVSTVVLGLACACAVVRPAAEAPLFRGIGAGLAVDGLSALLVITVAATTLAVLVYSAGEFGPDQDRPRFFGLMLLFSGAMLVTVTATNLATLLFGWEAMGATSWALIGFWWREPRRVRAGTTAFLTTRAADLGLYLAAGAAVAGGAGTLALTQLPHVRSPWLTVVTLGVALAALGKSAQLPFSFWLARAMEGPSPVSALLHSATMVAAGAYLLLRTQPLLAASGWGAPAVAWVGGATALVLGLVAVFQRDLKQLLAASTCAQIGYMVLAAGVGAVAGGAMQLIAHATVKSLLFLAAGAWLTALGTKQLAALRGAARYDRAVGLAFAAGSIALAGVPPASLWVAKDELLASAFERALPLYAIGLAAAVVSAVYSVKALWLVWQPALADAGARYDTERQGTRRITALMRAPLVMLALPALGLGALGLPPVADAINQLVGGGSEAVPRSWELGATAALALGAAGATWWWGGRGVGVPAGIDAGLASWLGLERLVHIAFVRPTLTGAGALATFDDRVLDGAVRAAASGLTGAASFTNRVLESSVEGFVLGVARGGRRLAILARRPQTGQLHQYYAQAVILLAVAAAILLLLLATR